MTSVKLKLHKNKLLKDGTYPLVFQIIHNRRKKVLYTNYKIRESDFDPVSGKSARTTAGNFRIAAHNG